MDTKGIVRRLDDLGRVVIPREYRKMYSIELGDPMEIYALDNGDIVLRKVDTGMELIRGAVPAAEILASSLNVTVMVSDLKGYVAGAGIRKANLMERELPAAAVSCLKDRKSLSGVTQGGAEGIVIKDSGFDYFAFAPIMNEDLFGGLFMFLDEPVSEPAFTSLKIAALIVGNSLQKY